MTINDVKKYLHEKNLFRDPKIKRLGVGNNYQVFRVEEDGQRFSLRIGRDDVVVENLLDKEYFNLKFLEECGIDFVPRVVFFDEENKRLLLTYISGRGVGVNNLSFRQIEDFVHKLNILHRLSYKKYQKFCRKYKISAKAPETPLEHIQRSGIDRFKYIDEHCKRRDLVEWIRPKLAANVEYVKKTPCNDRDIIFCHGDLAGANIFLDHGELFFIDWDKARFLHNTDYYLGYMFIHGEVKSARRRNKIIGAYAQENKIKESDLKNIVQIRTQITKVNDVIWAVMRYTEMIEGGFKNPEQYLKIAKRRIKEYDSQFPISNF